MAFPYYPAYQPQMYQNQYNPQQNSGLIWVKGIEAAKSYPVSAGQSVLLMDSESNAFFIKTADATGKPHAVQSKRLTTTSQHTSHSGNLIHAAPCHAGAATLLGGII